MVQNLGMCENEGVSQEMSEDDLDIINSVQSERQ